MLRSTLSQLPRKLLRGRLAQLALCTVAGLAGLQSSAHAATYTAVDSAALTSRLASVVLGDTIILNANTTYTGPFTLTDKGAGTSYITIQSSNLGSLPGAGVRVNTSHAGNMPKVRAPSGTGGTAHTAINTSGAAHHYKFIGIEFIAASDDLPETILIEIGKNTSAQTQLSQVPHHITFDRCIVRANSGTQRLRRAFALHSADTQIINCRVADCKDQGSGDSQAVAITNGPGPYLIDNCFLEAASEHILVGGSPVQIANMVPSNITVTRNHFYKPLAWKTQSWNVKNHFELKAGNNVLVDGNIMENCWHQAGDFKGTSISLKRIAQPDQGNTWTSTDNVTISNNIIRHVGTGISLAGSTDPGWGPGGTGDIIWTQSGWPKNVTIRNNLWHDITGPDFWAGNTAQFINMGSGGPNTKFDHNTAFITQTTGSSRIAEIWGGPYTGFEFTNNIVMDGQLYNFRSTLGNGEGTFDNFMGGPAGMVYKKNVTVDVTSSLLLPNYHGDWGLAPFSNTNLAFPVGFSTVLVNHASPGTNYAGWKVLGWNQATNFATYPYNNSGTDGKDIGCDIDLVNSKTAGCISGVWSAPPVTKILKNGLNGYTGSTSFETRGQSPTTHFGSSAWYHQVNSLAGTHSFGLRTFYKFDVSAAASGIPAGAVIDSAKFRVKVELKDPATGDAGASCYRVAPVGGAFTVNYATATRNTYNGTNAWTGGANAAGQVSDSNNDYIDTPAGTVSAIPAAGSWMEFTVTSAVQAWVNGTANNGLLIINNVIPSGPTCTTRLSAPADNHGSAEYPELEVTYH